MDEALSPMSEGRAQISPDLFKEARLLEVAARRRLLHEYSGLYTSLFRGSGLEFRELAEYSDTDDCRSIDWKSSARSHRVLRKVFEEERRRNVFIALDRSSSMDTPQSRALWSRLVALLTLSAIQHGDSVGYVRLTPNYGDFIPPQGRQGQFFRILTQALEKTPPRSLTNLASGVRALGGALPRSSIIFIISDFISPTYSVELSVLARRHDVICCYIDPVLHLPSSGLLEIEDAEGGQTLLFDCSSMTHRAALERQRASREEDVRSNVRGSGCDFVAVRDDVLSPLLSLMHTRQVRDRA